MWWLPGHFNSNVTFSTDTYSHLVWASRDESLSPVVAYRAYNKPGAGQVTYFYAGPWRGAVYPTVAADYGTPVSIFYEDEGRIIKRRFDGGYWLEEGFSEGRYPNAAAHGQSGAVWSSQASAPYRIVSDYVDPWKMRPNREDTLLVNKRFDYTFVERNSPSEQDTSAGYLTLEIRNLACGGGYLQLDSLLRSRPITIPANASPQYQLLIHFHNLNFPVDSSAVLVEAAFEAGPNIHSLGKLRLKQLLPFNNGQTHILAQTLPAGHLRGKTGRLKFRFETLSPLISNVVVRRPERGVPPLAKPGADSSSTLPTRFELSQNYPNPFNPTTTITLSLPQDSRVSLQVYDVTGRKVRTLADQPLPAGGHKIAWDGRNEGGEPVSSGVYIYRVVAGGFVESRKMVLMR
ncbi:MAG: T9SS type A sorting domain-containing protein [Calditrichaceae bacterium]|nr:T9SS type A sorting domain-containing protein [Calditrichia bacterium]NUQ39833.1 T9SS type A sorting domain-containing protein [Calditrichaceae bacterium]